MQGEVLHYNVVRRGGGDFSIQGDSRSFLSLDELVDFYRCSRGRLATRLRRPLSQATLPVKATMTTRYCEMFEIDRADVSFSSKTLSCPAFYSCHRVYIGTYKRHTTVLYRTDANSANVTFIKLHRYYIINKKN